MLFFKSKQQRLLDRLEKDARQCPRCMSLAEHYEKCLKGLQIKK